MATNDTSSTSKAGNDVGYQGEGSASQQEAAQLLVAILDQVRRDTQLRRLPDLEPDALQARTEYDAIRQALQAPKKEGDALPPEETWEIPKLSEPVAVATPAQSP